MALTERFRRSPGRRPFDRSLLTTYDGSSGQATGSATLAMASSPLTGGFGEC